MDTPKGSFLENNVQTKIFVSGTDTYICLAGIGTALTEKGWAIKKIDVDGNVTYPINVSRNRVEFSFSFIANDYAGYTYDYSIPVIVVPPAGTAPTITPELPIYNLNNSTVPSVKQIYYDIADVDGGDLKVTITVDDGLVSLDGNAGATTKSLIITGYQAGTHSFFYHNDGVTDNNFDAEDLVILTVEDSTLLTGTNSIIIAYN